MEQKLNKFKRKLVKNKQSDADIFEINALLEYGFPAAPSAIDFDSNLGLLAISCKTGEVRIYGAHGIQLQSFHSKPTSVTQVLFIPGEGRLVSVGCEGNRPRLSLFETSLDGNSLEELKIVYLDSGEDISTCSFSSDFTRLFIGTKVGHVRTLDVEKFKLQEDSIGVNIATQNVPDDLKADHGKVQTVATHPTDENLLLIGYNSGLLILWNLSDSLPQGTFFTSCEKLTSVSWYRDGSKFVTSHEDGSYFTWHEDLERQYNGPQQVFPFGQEEPGSGLKKIQVQLTGGEDELIIMAGGLPKDTYATVECLTVRKGTEEVNYELGSKFVDFIVIQDDSAGDEGNIDHPNALMILTEEELIVVDLQLGEMDGERPIWPTFKKPYLNSVSPNDVTCIHVFQDSDTDFIERLTDFGKHQFSAASFRKWPVTGGESSESNSAEKSLLLTGHYDGTVRFYDINCGKFELLYTLNLSCYFKSEDFDDENIEHNGLGDIKLRKIGEEFNVSSDDNRFGICKLYLCVKSHSLYVASHSGQVVVFDFDGANPTDEIPVHELKIVSDHTGLKWKGCHPARAEDPESFDNFPAGYCIVYVVQCEPPAPVTALAVNSHTKLIAIGTNHGFGVFDCARGKSIFVRDTLVENDEATSGQKLSKTKSLKEGIRNSFRRLRPKKAAEATAEVSVSVSPTSPQKPPRPAQLSVPDDTQKEVAVEEKKEEEGACAVEEKQDDEVTQDEDKKEEAEGKEDKKEEEDGKTEETIDRNEEGVEDSGEMTASGDTATSDARKQEDMESSVEPPPKTDEQKQHEAVEQPSTSTTAPTVTIVEPDERQIGRVVVARGEGQDKTLQSTVRCVSFAETFLRNSRESSHSLWIGTHAGTVYSYLIHLPDNRDSDAASLRLAKEIKLHHRAPIVYITVLDHSGFPTPDPAAVAASKVVAPDMSGHHHLLVCSEEQVKLFTLPALKSKYKEKITAVHGVKVRKVSTMKCKLQDETHNFLTCMLGDGSISVFSLPALYCQYSEQLVDSNNKVATVYTEFTQDGSAYSLNQTNLIKHLALLKSITSPMFTIALPDGARALPEPDEPAVIETPAPVEEAASSEEEKHEEEVNKDEPGSSQPPEDMPTVEDEAKKMIEEAEEEKESEFQRRIQEELTPDNPELTTVSTTTYTAIESRTVISADDGNQMAKVITTTRDTTLAVDGEVITQKTQQKEEFEVLPTEGEPTAVTTQQEDEEAKGEESPRKASNASSTDMNEPVEAESIPVRTATLTRQKENNDSVGDHLDEITHHIGAPDEAKEEQEPEGFFGACYGGSSGNLYSPLAREREGTTVEAPVFEDGIQGVCYGGSNGELYSPMSREEQLVDAPIDEGLKGACYGASQGELYSPLSREDQQAEIEISLPISEGDIENENDKVEVTPKHGMPKEEIEISPDPEALQNGGELQVPKEESETGAEVVTGKKVTDIVYVESRDSEAVCAD